MTATRTCRHRRCRTQPVEPRQRLHPLSPLLHGAKLAGRDRRGAVLADPRPGRARLVRRHGGRCSLLGVVVLSVVSWYNTGYHVVGRELRIHEGLLWRRTRAIPLERLQSVEVVPPAAGPAHRPGRAAAGGGRRGQDRGAAGVPDGAPTRPRCASGCSAWPGRTPPPAAAGRRARPRSRRRAVDAPRRHLLAVANRDLLISQLLTPQAMFLPFGVAFVVIQFVSEGVLVVHRRRQHADRDGRRAAAAGAPGARRLELPAGPRRGRAAAYGTACWRPAARPCRWTGCRRSGRPGRCCGGRRAGCGCGWTWPAVAGPDVERRQRPTGCCRSATCATARAGLAEVLPGVDLAALPLTPPPAGPAGCTRWPSRCSAPG